MTDPPASSDTTPLRPGPGGDAVRSAPLGAEARRTRDGILLMVGATFVFAVQDAFSRHLGERYPILMVVMIRYWFFAAFVITLGVRQAGGIRAAAATRAPWLQVLRGLLLVGEICVMVVAFVALGLVQTHAVFICYPLIVAALSGPVLGERVGWQRWAAIAAGLVGVLIVLGPGLAVFRPAAILPLVAATMFALYGLLTRYVARFDSTASSFFWTGTVGAAAATAAGIWTWTPMAPEDWGWMGALCLSGAFGHWLLIKCYELAEAGVVQPFAFLQLIFAAAIGVTVFGETLTAGIVLGAAVVVAAGLFTILRERRQARSAR